MEHGQTIRQRRAFGPGTSGRDFLLSLAMIGSLLLGVAIPGGQTAAQNVKPSADAALVGQLDTLRADLARVATRAPNDTEGYRRLKTTLTGSLTQAVASGEDLDQLLVNLTEVSKLADDGKRDTGFVRDPSVTRMLALSLSSRSPDTRELAAHLMLDRVTPAHVRASADDIRRGLAGISRGEAIRIEALLPLDPGRIGQILAGGDVPLEVRAKLGDAKAQDELVHRFVTAQDFESKSQWATLLGYVGNDACARALISEFNSPIVGEFKYFHISIRCPIIQALGRIHPDEPLLTSELHRFIDQGDDAAGTDSVQNYVVQVATWAGQKLGVQISPAALPVFYKKIIYILPLGGGEERPLNLSAGN